MKCWREMQFDSFGRDVVGKKGASVGFFCG